MERFTGIIWGIGLFLCINLGAVADEFRFPYREALAGEVAFWKQIFTRYSQNQYVLHDSEYPYIQYKVVTFDDKITRRQRERILAAEKRRIRELLQRLHDLQDQPALFTPEEQRIFQQFKTIPDPNKFLAASKRVRAQQGIREQFKAGVERSFRYLPHIKKVFRMYGIPEAIGYLPHMESSFNPRAVSHVRAVGMWQFMRSTARHFMRVNRIRDERWDPYISTHAAARLLKRNYQALKDWGLAITAYNYGLAGLRRAVRRFGRDYLKIRQNYLSRRFGFASRNFYPEFLAVVEIVDSLEHYFPNLQPHPPLQFTEILLPVPTRLSRLIRALKLPEDSIRLLNPAYRNAVWQGRVIVPAGYPLRLPASVSAETVLAYLQLQNPNYLAQVNKRKFTKRTVGWVPVAYQVLPPEKGQVGLDRWRSGATDLAERKEYSHKSWHRPAVASPNRMPRGWVTPALIAYIAQTAPLFKPPSPSPLLASAGRDPVQWLAVFSGDNQVANHNPRVGVEEPRRVVWQAGAWQSKVQERIAASTHYLAVVKGPPTVDDGSTPSNTHTLPLHPGVQTYLAYLNYQHKQPAQAPATPSVPSPVAGQSKKAPTLATLMVSEGMTFTPHIGGPNADGVPEAHLVPTTPKKGHTLVQQRIFRREVFRQWLAKILTPDRKGNIMVYQGETLEQLARWAGISVNQLRRINRLSSARLFVGQRLKIPRQSKDDSPFVRQRLAFHWRQLPAAIQQAHWLGVRSYTVRQGETLSRIAAHNSEITVNILLYFNEFHKLKRMYPGEEIAVIYVIN